MRHDKGSAEWETNCISLVAATPLPDRELVPVLVVNITEPHPDTKTGENVCEVAAGLENHGMIQTPPFNSTLEFFDPAGGLVSSLLLPRVSFPNTTPGAVQYQWPLLGDPWAQAPPVVVMAPRGAASVILTVDSDNEVVELNEGDNTLTGSLSGCP